MLCVPIAPKARPSRPRSAELCTSIIALALSQSHPPPGLAVLPRGFWLASEAKAGDTGRNIGPEDTQRAPQMTQHDGKPAVIADSGPSRPDCKYGVWAEREA